MNTLDVQNENLKELVIDKSYTKIICSHNKISELIIPDGVVYLDCSFNKIKKLILPKSLKFLDCSHNKIEVITTTSKMQSINCSYNKISELNILHDMRGLDCSFNLLKSLVIYTSVAGVECSFNQIERLILRDTESVICNNNRIREMIPNHSMTFLDIRNNLIQSLDLSHCESSVFQVLFINNPIKQIITQVGNDLMDEILPPYIIEMEYDAYKNLAKLNINNLTELRNVCIKQIENKNRIDVLYTFNQTTDELIRNGFMPSDEQVAINYINGPLITKIYDDNVNDSTTWYYANLEYYKEIGIKNGNSAGLQLFFPSLVYKSKRAINNMNMYRFPGSMTMNQSHLTDETLIPVTRYSDSMESGLFYGRDIGQEQGGHEFCGTFYFGEPESKTYLMVKKDRVLSFDTKSDAYNYCYQKGAMTIDEYFLCHNVVQIITDDKRFIIDGCMVDANVFEGFANLTNEERERVKDLKLYSNEYDAYEDSLDQRICLAGKTLGIDVFIFKYVPGSRQVNMEVLDTRPRKESFKSLVFG